MQKNEVISKRCISIDIMRGLTVFLMVAVHMALLINMGQIASFGIFIIPFFLMISGTSCEFFLSSRYESGYIKKKVFLEVLCRAFILYLISIIGLYLGHILLPAIYPQFHFFIWSFFQLVAIGYIVSLILPNKIEIRVLLIILVYILTFFAENYNYLYFFRSGDRPPLPYIAYFWFGQIAFQIINNNLIFIKLKKDNLVYNFYFFLYSIICLLTCCLLDIDIYVENPNRALAFALTSSAYLSMVIILMNTIDYKYRNNKIVHIVERPGRIAFTIYYIHIPIIYFIIYTFLSYYPFLNKPPFTTMILISFFIVIALFEIKWRKYNYLLGMEWFLREGTKQLLNIALRSRFHDRTDKDKTKG